MSTPLLKRRVNQTEYVDHPIGNTTTTLGRSRECDIAIEDTSLSRLHLRIEKRSGTYYLVDNNSSNGTFVNRRKVSEAPLIDGDEIVAGRIHFYFHHKEATEGSATRPMPAMTVSATISANLEDFPSVDNMIPPYFEETQTTPPEALKPPPPRLPPDPPMPSGIASPSRMAPPPPPPAQRPQASPVPPPPMSPPPKPPSWSSPLYAASSTPAETQEIRVGVLATPVQRLLAALIDGGLIIAVAVVIAVVGFVSSTLALILALPLYLALLAHPIVGWLKYRKTLGKHVMGLEIEDLADPNGTGLSPRTVLMRFIGMFVCGLTMCLGYLLIFFDPNRQGLHDKIAGTRVIQRKR